jgi:hypothetical protein
MDAREQLQKEPPCQPRLCVNQGNSCVEDFWRHQLNRIKDKAEEKRERENA